MELSYIEFLLLIFVAIFASIFLTFTILILIRSLKFHSGSIPKARTVWDYLKINGKISLIFTALLYILGWTIYENRHPIVYTLNPNNNISERLVVLGGDKQCDYEDTKHYFRNNTSDTIYEVAIPYQSSYSLSNSLINQRKLIQIILPHNLVKLKERPYNIMQGIPDKIEFFSKRKIDKGKMEYRTFIISRDDFIKEFELEKP